MSVIVNDTTGFSGEATNIPIGKKYSSFENEEYNVERGDIVVFDDPDVGMHVGECELISSHVHVARVKTVYAFNPSYKDGIEVQVGVYGGMGRLSIGDRYVYTPESTDNPDRFGEREAERFRNSEYSKWMATRDHYDPRDMPEEIMERHNERTCNFSGGDGLEVNGE